MGNIRLATSSSFIRYLPLKTNCHSKELNMNSIEKSLSSIM